MGASPGGVGQGERCRNFVLSSVPATRPSRSRWLAPRSLFGDDGWPGLSGQRTDAASHKSNVPSEPPGELACRLRCDTGSRGARRVEPLWKQFLPYGFGVLIAGAVIAGLSLATRTIGVSGLWLGLLVAVIVRDSTPVLSFRAKRRSRRRGRLPPTHGPPGGVAPPHGSGHGNQPIPNRASTARGRRNIESGR